MKSTLLRLQPLVLLLLALGILAPRFFAWDNLRDIALQNAAVLVAATGMTAILLARQIDVSIGSQFAICGVLAGLLAQRGAGGWTLAAAAAAAGFALGALNGWLVAIVRVPAIVATLASMVVLREALRWPTGGAWIQDLPASSFQWFGLGQRWGQFVILGAALSLFLLAAWILRSWRAGRAVYAIGSDAEAARLVGLHPQRIVFFAFAALGSLTGLAALLNAVRFAEVPTSAGLGFELKVIAAVVVGGTSINGGRGTLPGTLYGVVLLGLIGPALTYAGVSAYWEKALQGVIILAAVIGDGRRAR